MPRARLFHQGLEQLPGLIRSSAATETWPGALAGVGHQGELGHQKQAASNLAYIQIHLAGIVCENAVTEQTLKQSRTAGRGVRGFHPDQGQDAPVDAAHGLAPDLDMGPGDALDEGDHAGIGPFTGCINGILAGRTLIFAGFLRVSGILMIRSSLKAVVSMLAVVGLVLAEPAAAAGDPAKGKTLGYTCLGCHGIETYKNVYPTYSVPKLRGQHAEYIVAALKAYRSGERGHATMHAHATSLSDQDMEDIAAYLGGEAVKTAAGAKPVGTAPAAVATCQACHGADGVGIMGLYPTLSGQYADYLEQALHDYQKGIRKNGIMAPFVSALKPEEIKEVAQYFSRQKPTLKTVPIKEKALTAAK